MGRGREDDAEDVLLTIDTSPAAGGRLVVECHQGTPVGAIADAIGLGATDLWCGPTPLHPGHRAGEAPLTHLAVITTQAGTPGTRWPGPHLISVDGPDAGRVIALADGSTVGRLGSKGWRDPSMNDVHAVVRLHQRDRIRLVDAGSVNGTKRSKARRVWTIPGQGLFGRVLLCPGQRALLGATTVEWRPRHTDARPVVAWADDPLWRASTSPTELPWWRQEVTITGPARAGLTRAIILTRGRQLPWPRPATEPWHHLLPDAQAHDAPVRWSAEPPSAVTTVVVHADHNRTRVTVPGTDHTLDGPAYTVACDTADQVARALATGELGPPPATTLGDLAPRGICRGTPVAISERAPVTVGVVAGAEQSPWSLPGEGPWCVLVAGAPGSGKSTALATIAAAVIASQPTYRIVAIAHDPIAATEHVTPGAATGFLGSLALPGAHIASPGTPTLIVIDDAHLLAPQAVTLVRNLALRSAHDATIRVVITVQSPLSVFTAPMIARASALISLRSANAAASRDLVGVADAALLSPAHPGMAVVRQHHQCTTIRFALPTYTTSPAARIIADSARVVDDSARVVDDLTRRSYDDSARASAF